MRKILAVVFLAAFAPGAFAACEKSEVLRCYIGAEIGGKIGDFAKMANRRGKIMFGENFAVVNRLRFSKYSKTMRGDFDAAFPRGGVVWQTGLTEWTDSKKLQRHDFRGGGVMRFAGDGGMWGFWGFMQGAAVRNHARAAFGMEYEGQFGRAAASFYAPLTGWQTGRAGYAERALGGGDLSMRIQPARKIKMSARLSHWESAAGGRRLSGRLNWDYAPRNWLKLSGAWQARHGRKDSMSFFVRLNLLAPARRNRHGRRAADYSKKLLHPARAPKRISVREKLL